MQEANIFIITLLKNRMNHSRKIYEMIIKKKESIIIYTVFAFLVLFYGINNYFLVKNYYSFPIYADEAFHLTTSLRYHEIFRNFSLSSYWK